MLLLVTAPVTAAVIAADQLVLLLVLLWMSESMACLTVQVVFCSNGSSNKVEAAVTKITATTATTATATATAYSLH